MEKRYQYLGKGGEVMWTKWFKCEHNQGDIQYKGRITLRNEYR